MVSVAFKQNLKKKYGIKFNNEKLLEDAFTHSSYANEHSGRKDYEKLEFLGDAVLELAVSDYLYRHFPRLNEGELTRMRSNIVRTEGFSEFEAFNGALFLDQGMPAVQHFLHLTVYPLIAEGDFNASRDYKTELQERLQVNGPVKIEYQVISEDESKPSFKVQLLVNGEKVSEGQGRNKKAAEQQAAQAALDKNK